MKRNRYMISWVQNGRHGRDGWIMERRGSINHSDILKLEIDLGKKWGLSSPVVITNIVKIN